MENKSEIKTIKIFTDGGSRGNPGPSAIGVYISDELGEDLAEIGKVIGIGTNNRAEYGAIIEGLNWVIEHKNDFPSLSQINFFMDSNLAASQLNGFYKIKNPDIRSYIFDIRKREMEIGVKITYTHVPREENRIADRLVNLALDNKLEPR